MSVVKLLRDTLVFLSCLLCLAASLPAREKPKASAQSEDAVGQAEALLALSERQNYDNHSVALQTAQRALGLWQALANNEGVARAYTQIAACYFAQSDLPEAIVNYESALGLWRSLNNPQEQAGILIMLSYIEDRKGDWSNSISLLTQAQSLIGEENDPFRMGQIASGLADIFNESGLPENGLIQYQRALDYYRKTPDTIDDAMTIWALGSTHYLLGNYAEAVTHLQQALASVPPGKPYAAICSEYLGRVYGSMGDFPGALRHLQSALDIYTWAVNPREAARVRGIMGQIYQQQGKLARARQYYQEALVTFRNLSDRINQAAIYFAIGRLELKDSNYEVAERNLRQSIESTENIRRVPTSRDLTTAFTASIYERYESYIECLMLKHQAESAQGFSVRAFETSELARGRALAELLRATETNLAPGLDRQLAAQEKALRQALRAKEDYKVTLLSSAYKKEELGALQIGLARLEAEHKQLSGTIRARYPSYGQMTNPEAWDLRQIQEEVIADDQTLLLEYSLGSDKSYVWVVTRDRITSYALPPRKLIDEAAAKVYKLLSSSPSAEVEKELNTAVQELGRIVLSPLTSEINKRRIIIVADGALHYIPFQVLPAPSATDKPLVAEYEIINAPSASILGQLRKEAIRRKPTKLLAAFGDPTFESDYAQRKEAADGGHSDAVQALELAPWRRALRDVEMNGDSYDPTAVKRLFYAKQELANLRKAASGGEVSVSSGAEATRDKLLNTDLSQYSILHFATHGFLDSRRPEYSGLVLSTVTVDGQPQNGFVSLQDIYGLRAPVDLVVLSACQTALGKDVRGEGLLGLTRGFMYAGASSVVASLWKVEDEATSELMRQFYNNILQRGMTPAAALGDAQNRIRQRPEWRSPYYWAGFTLQGEYREIIRLRTATATIGVAGRISIGGAATLLLAAALWYRRYKRRRDYSTTKR